MPDAPVTPHSAKAAPLSRGRKYSTAFQERGLTGVSQQRTAPGRAPSAESFYFQKQMQNHVELTVTLENNDRMTGTLEWFDDTCIKLRCGDGSRVVIYKHGIRYICKHGDE